MKHSKWFVNGLLALASFLFSLSLAELGIVNLANMTLTATSLSIIMAPFAFTICR